MSKEIMQQALDDLKWADNEINDWLDDRGLKKQVHFDHIIPLLEAELAKPEQPDLRKAAEMALEVLERGTTGLAIRAIPALRQALAQPEFDTPESHIVKWSIPVDPNNFGEALAQPEQEPVAWMLPDYGDVLSASEADGTGIYNIPLYTSPPCKEWVGLTDEEIETLIHRFDGDPHTLLDEVNARLKKKNNAV